VFDFVRTRLIESMSSDDHKDGFDGVLLCVNRTTGHIACAAAYNSVVLVRGSEVIYVHGDKMPVGKGEKSRPFTTHPVPWQPGDMLYVFTDGYADQFGGERGKKFMHKRLESVLSGMAGQSPAEQKRILDETHRQWKGQLEQVDDICCFGMRL
jgi:serine phosphatase RsbU (regulator of sigma subunit)